MLISLVAALARNGVIGVDNRLPWRLPADLRHFRHLTMGKPVLMGRKTFQSIGKPLPGRTNIVVTRDADFQAPGVIVVDSITAGIQAAEGHEELMVIGGASIYEAMLPQAGRMYLTFIHQDFAGDARFVDYDKDEWVETMREDHPADDDNPCAYSFVTLERKH
ncbi:MAG TPA: type 3 dihydrofolate reductase [Gammaproteobacteria bacterium]|nr:type 3 dihydrofolate reductase [Gammaproteobacteria bacterium]